MGRSCREARNEGTDGGEITFQMNVQYFADGQKCAFTSKCFFYFGGCPAAFWETGNHLQSYKHRFRETAST